MVDEQKHKGWPKGVITIVFFNYNSGHRIDFVGIVAVRDNI